MKKLYVNRKLKNPDNFIEWAKSNNFSDILHPDKFHVTIVYSRKTFDSSGFTELKDDVIVSGGKRSIEKFGDGILVLKFESEVIHNRWKQFLDAGASWDYPVYNSHVTITYSGKELDISNIKPYDGDLIFGAEVFEELNLDWSPDNAES